MSYPRNLMLKLFALLAVGSATLTSCSADSNGPVASGASYGSLGSANMSDYYYKKEAGWVYTFQNVQRKYDANGNLSQTLRGSDDIVRTMGPDGFAPNGDTLYRVEIDYHVLPQFADKHEMSIRYVTKGTTQRGAFIDGGATIDGQQEMGRRPRPVSTDTIIAGVVGRIRTLTDDFSGSQSTVVLRDTLWFTAHGDSVFIWEAFAGVSQPQRSRLLFCRDFTKGDTWNYDQVDLVQGNLHPTLFKVADKDQSVTTLSGTYTHTVDISVITPEVYDNMPIKEHKWFACGIGFIKEFDEWYVTTNGQTKYMQDYTHSLVSVVHQ